MPTVIRYSRRSSETGDNQNLDTQDDYDLRYISANNLGDSIPFQQNVTGTIHLRERHTKKDPFDLWADVESRRVKMIVVKSIDRLSRASTRQALDLIADLKYYGCAVHCSDVGLLDPDDIGTIIRAWASYLEKTRTVERLRDNKMGKAAKRWVGSGPTPYGYAKNGTGKDAALLIDAETSAVVRWMFETYADGATLRGLETDLNRRGIKSPAGGLWRGPGSVSAILRRSIYCGRVTFGGVCVVDDKARIIPAELFERVQERLRYNAENSRRNTKAVYLMRGHVYCYCGHKMGLDGPQYRCNALSYPKGHPGRCMGSIRISRVDAAVTDYILEAMTDEFLTLGIQEKERQDATQLRGRSVDDIDADIAQRRSGIDRLMRAYADGDDAAQKTIETLRAEIDTLNAERSRLVNAEATAANRRAARESIAQHVARLRVYLASPTPELLRDLVEIMEIVAHLQRDDGARSLRVSSAIGADVVYPL